MRIFVIQLWTLILFSGLQLHAQMTVDTTWLQNQIDGEFKSVYQPNAVYKVTKKGKGKLFIHTYSPDHRLESAFVLDDKQIKDRKAESITYLPDGKTRRVVFSWDEDMKELVREFYNPVGDRIGKAVYRDLYFDHQFYFKRGTEVNYYHQAGPKLIQTKADGIITEEKRFYKNGQLAEHFKLAENLKHGVSTFYSPKGEELGFVEYLYNTKRKKKTLKQGEKYIYNTSEVLGKAIVDEKGGIKEKIFFTKPKNESVLYLGNKPFEGVDYGYEDGIKKSKAVYAEGEKIEEIFYFKNGNIKSQSKGLQTVFYKQSGDKIGIGYQKVVDGRARHESGVFVKYLFTDIVSEVSHYKDGIRTKIDKYKPVKDHKSSFLHASVLNAKINGVATSLFYYSTGVLKAKHIGQKNASIITTFNEQGDTLGVYDERNKDGVRYKFFGLAGYYDLYYEIETYKKGKRIYYKKWYIPTGNISKQDDLQPLYDYDYSGKAKTYAKNGNLKYSMEFKDGLPWNGKWDEEEYGSRLWMYTYKDGVKQGDFIEYGRRKTAYVVSTGKIESGQIQGIRKYYNHFEELEKTEMYVDGKKNGKTLYYRDGKVWKEELYNEKIEKSIVFNKKGKIIRSLDYKYGKPYSGLGEIKYDNYKTKYYKYSLTKYVDGERYRTYKYYDDKIYKINGRLEGSSKPFVFFKAETEERYADLTRNSYKGRIDSVTYYNTKDKPFLLGQFRKNNIINGHLFLQKDDLLNGPTLVHVNKNGNKITINVFNSQNNLVMSNYMEGSHGLLAYLKTHFGKHFKISKDRFELSTPFQEFIQSKAFYKKYIGDFNGGLKQ